LTKFSFSNRMKALASFVIENEPAADIGTDHGFVPIYLLAENIVPHAILTDINGGPLEKARGNLERVGILPHLYELRRCDGLDLVENSEVSSVIIAGMGAETIIDILSWDISKTRSFKRFILQPRKKAHLLREWLCDNEFSIIEEMLVKEDDKICEIIVAQPGFDKEFDKDFYLPKLLHKSPLFKEFLDDYIKKLEAVIENMNNSPDTKDVLFSWEERLKKAKELKNELS